jgi:hypothetical protein
LRNRDVVRPTSFREGSAKELTGIDALFKL